MNPVGDAGGKLTLFNTVLRETLTMQSIVNAVVQSAAFRALILIVVIIPISFYLGTSPVRRGILYYLEVFAPSVVIAIAVGLLTWSWKRSSIVLAMCMLLTIVTQTLTFLFW